MLVMAIPKGRMLPFCLKSIEKAGIIKQNNILMRRSLVFKLDNDITLFIVRNIDILTYIKNNIADIAYVGSDILQEEQATNKIKETNYYDYGDSGLSNCQLMSAAKSKESLTNNTKRLRIATKYVNIAAKFYAKKSVQTDIIKINGSVELAARIGFADQIVDIVDSGRTLKENGLVPLEKIADVSTRIVINKNAMKTKHKQINSLIRYLVAEYEN